MSKIKLVQPGWLGYTGMFGIVEFVDGISVDDVSRMEAERLGSIVQCERIEDGSNPSITHKIHDERARQASTVELPKAEAPKIVVPSKNWAESELQDLADKHGIKGLRAVGDPLAVKGNSILELIAKILTAQKEAAASVAQAAAEQPAE